MEFEYIEPEWDAKYVRMLDALIEYLDSIGQREVTTINQRDITIIKALVEFYDFEVQDNQDLLDIMDDVKERAKELDLTDEEE
jgi:hypothetical protein